MAASSLVCDFFPPSPFVHARFVRCLSDLCAICKGEDIFYLLCPNFPDRFLFLPHLLCLILNILTCVVFTIASVDNTSASQLGSQSSCLRSASLPFLAACHCNYLTEAVLDHSGPCFLCRPRLSSVYYPHIWGNRNRNIAWLHSAAQAPDVGCNRNSASFVHKDTHKP